MVVADPPSDRHVPAAFLVRRVRSTRRRGGRHRLARRHEPRPDRAAGLEPGLGGARRRTRTGPRRGRGPGPDRDHRRPLGRSPDRDPSLFRLPGDQGRDRRDMDGHRGPATGQPARSPLSAGHPTRDWIAAPPHDRTERRRCRGATRSDIVVPARPRPGDPRRGRSPGGVRPVLVRPGDPHRSGGADENRGPASAARARPPCPDIRPRPAGGGRRRTRQDRVRAGQPRRRPSLHECRIPSRPQMWRGDSAGAPRSLT